jgi:hypothetical protein
MKKLNILFLILLTMMGFNSCQDQMGVKINPMAENGTLRFHLNQPIYSNYVLTDANSLLDMDSITCVQPDYGFTAAVNYTTQVSFDSTFTAGTYQSLPTTVNGQKVGMNTKEMDKAIIALYGGKLPDPVVEKNIFIRLMAIVSTSITSPTDSIPVVTVKPLFSNAISIKILPYILPLFPYTELTPRLWFIIGLGNHWDNSVAGLGSSLIPLNLSDGKKYNLSGDGEFTYTGYFKAAESFKLVRDYTSATPWNEFWGMSGGVYKHNSGDNIAVTTDGYYTLTLNSIDNTLTIVPAANPINNFTSIGLIGDFNSWATDVSMTASLSANNHVWYTTYTFANDYAAAGGCKFRANGAWTFGWGGPVFPYGIATSSNGANILFKAGTYVIIFNDLDAKVATTGTYYFIKK